MIGDGLCAIGPHRRPREISVSRGFIVSGPREQLSPTIVAPASAARRQAST